MSTSGSDALQIDSNYIEIDGLEVTNPQGHGINGEDNHHITVLNCHAYNCGNSGITFGHNPNTKSPVPCDYYRAEGNITHNNARLGFYRRITLPPATAIHIKGEAFNSKSSGVTTCTSCTPPYSSEY